MEAVASKDVIDTEHRLADVDNFHGSSSASIELTYAEDLVFVIHMA